MGALKKIKSENLTLQDLPLPASDWNELSLFALAFDPLEELGQVKWSQDILAQKLKDSYDLKELRTYLYLMQRWWNNRTTAITAEALGNMNKAVELIRIKLANR